MTSPHPALDTLAGRTIVGGFDGTTLPRTVAERLARGHLAGVTLFKRNLVDAEQARALCAEIVRARADAVISIDQEGGRVARLGAPIPVLPPMRALGTIDDPSLTQRVATALGLSLRAVGINLDFAPVCDVDSNPLNPVIGDRAFGDNPDLVARHVTAFIAGFRTVGILSCAKHFPGHGDTSQDSHLELPRVRSDRASLRTLELPPFRAAVAAGVDSVMTAHVVYEGLDTDTPATLLPAIVHTLLREELGFTGVCFSDDLHMKAISARMPIGEAGVRAIAAGCDGLLVCTDTDSQEGTRVALESRARGDERFATRLAEAARRMDALRTRAPARPSLDEATMLARIDAAGGAGVMAEIARRRAG